MTAAELAAKLDGRKIGTEILKAESSTAKDAGLVVVYGYSDDNVEFAGAIDGEVGAYDGATIHLFQNGILLEPECGIAENIECPYFSAAKRAAETIKAVWHDKCGPFWTFETDIPHETFTIMEDGEPWCIGMVFSMKDLEVMA